MEPKPGDYVEASLSDEKIQGILIQSPESEQSLLIIKLDSGYNLGILKEKVSKIALIKKKPSSRQKPNGEPKKNKNLPNLSILHTGGTIASKVDYRTGGVTARFSPEEFLEMFPELHDVANVSSTRIGQMQSEMIRIPHYNVMAEAIKKEIKKGTDGIIIAHGTDTLHYSSAALAFSLGKIPVPVILVGAQRSSDRGSTDAALNLISAAYFISNSDFSGVGICMRETINDNSCLILPALKTRKMHTSRRDAFRPVNCQPVARINYEEKKISFIDKNYLRKQKNRKVEVKLFDENLKVGLVKTHVNMFASQIEAYEGFDGLVIEATGLGNVPNQEIDEHTSENKRIHEAIKKLSEAGTIVVMAPQTIYGRIQMDVYTPQRDLQSIGVLGHLSDMTPETAFVKLFWLLSNFSKDETKKLMCRNLLGEISDRTEKNNFLN